MALRKSAATTLGFALVATASFTLESATIIYDGVMFPNSGYYDYAPTALSEEGLIKVWWCAPNDPYHSTGDGIWYRTWNGAAWSGFTLALAGTPNSWDTVHTCDPSIVRGQFTYQGGLYSYAMYYSGAVVETNTAVGVAFSNNGVNWVKHPQPVVTPTAAPATNYGAGMQTFLRQPGTSSSGWLVWYDSTWPGGPANVYAYTTNGINFGPAQVLGTLASRGYIGDIAYSPIDQLYFATFMNVGQSEITVYSFQDPLQPWTTVGTLGVAQTGNARNHNPAFVRVDNGNLYMGPGGIKYVMFGTGGEPTAGPWEWELGYAHWY